MDTSLEQGPPHGYLPVGPPDMDALTIAANWAYFWRPQGWTYEEFTWHIEEHPVCRGYWYLHDIQED